MENKIEEVAKLLDVELEEEFKITNSDTKYKLTLDGLMGSLASDKKWWYSNLLQALLIGKYQIIKLSKPILDDVEKEYLGNIIKPFRNKVIGITKYDYSTNGEYIHIKLKRTISPVDYFIPLESIDLPVFKRGIMYKGMELMREYNLKELEL